MLRLKNHSGMLWRGDPQTDLACHHGTDYLMRRSVPESVRQTRCSMDDCQAYSSLTVLQSKINTHADLLDKCRIPEESSNSSLLPHGLNS